MAILKGFPPTNLISPSVRIAERDLTFITAAPTGHRCGLVGFASKGPINIPTFVSTLQELHKTFGFPHPDVGDPYLIYAAEQYLQVGSELFVVRVADVSPVSDEAATVASVKVLDAGGPVQIESNIAGPYTFDKDRFFRWRLNGILASKILVVLSDANRPAPNTGMPYSVTDLVNALNAQLNPAIEGIQFYWTNPAPVTGAATLSSAIAVKSVFSFGPTASIELVSVQDAMYGPIWNGVSYAIPFTGLGQGMTAASITGTADRYPNNSSQVAGVFDFTGLSGLNLQIVIDGTDNILIDNVVQVVNIENDSSTISEIAADINEQITGGMVPGGFVAHVSGNNLVLSTLATGEDSFLLVKSDSTADVLLGLDSITHQGVSPSGTTGPGTYVDGIVFGSANVGTICFTITADSPGLDGNHTQVVITDSIVDGTFTMQVFSFGSPVESWGNLSKDQSSAFYVSSFLALVSDYIRVIDNTATLALPMPGTYQLDPGSDGIPSDPDDQDTLLVGTTTTMTGLQSLSDPEQINIDLVAIPGHPSTGNVLDLLNFCQNTREDCFAIIEPPFGLNVTEIIDWQNGVHPLNDTRFDSDFGALYWPWVQIRDTFNKVNVWVPPAGVVLSTYALSDSIGAPWFAPAGTTRGVVPGVLDVFSRPTLEERDEMYGNRNAVNPIISFPDLGNFVIFGQKTLQRRPSALDRVNVRRMLLFVEKQIKLNARDLIFEPNDPVLWNSFITMATNVMTPIKNRRGMTAFKIVCDSTLNTPDIIAQNEMRAQIGIQPVYAAEFIFIEFTLNKVGDFTETVF